MKRMALRTVLPALLAILLFCGVVFFYLLPSVDRVVMDQKRLMIRELTESAWNVLARFQAEEMAGRLDRQSAQEAAIAQVRNLHYGQQNKDYFFIIDEHPRMVVHPYRPDLEGQDLSAFGDPDGKLLFVEMARVVERSQAGYVSYRWQWKDDPGRIVPKLSYVKGFAPWGWILGTGVYTEDVDAEIAQLKGNLVTATWVILFLVALLMILLLRTSFQAERGRLKVAAALSVSEEKYRTLVESAGEAIVMSISGQGLFANASMLKLLGYTREEFARLDVARIILPTPEERRQERRFWQDVTDGLQPPTRYEAELQPKEGPVLRILLTLSRIVVQGRAGFMAVAARLAQPRELEIAAAANLDDLEAASRRTRDLAALMMRHGSGGLQVSGLLSDSADEVVQRAVGFITEKLGPPPVPFDIMLMGSLGRREVTLSADQDHAIIYQDTPEDQAEQVQAYFLEVGTMLADLFAAAGYPYCRGKIMSSEPACCQSLSRWCRTFARWIDTLEPDDLMHAKIFFDFRSALQEGHLVAQLRADLFQSLTRQPRFYPMLAHSILQYEPPLGPFGGLVLQETEEARAGFDIKGVLAQLVDVARLRCLQHGVAAVGTLERIEALAAEGHLKEKTAAEMTTAFTALMNLRLNHQARRRAGQLAVDNTVIPEELTPDEVQTLKQVLGQIKALKNNLQHEFGPRS
nr:cache domain-containing protein [Candidatus Krumholzibacteria bacterium]